MVLLRLIRVCAAGIGLLAASLADPAAAQPEPRTFEDFDRLIKRADHADAVYGVMLRPLEQARRLSGFLLRTESGAYTSISEEEARRLAAAVALNVMLYGTEGNPPPEIDRGSQMDMLIVRAIRDVYGAFGQYAGYVKSFGGRAPNPGRVGDYVEHVLLTMLDDLDRENRALLKGEIEKIENERRRLERMLATALELRNSALPSGAENGFLNRQGFYVLQVSGGGWRKRYSGSAHRIDGHQTFLVKVDDGTRQPRWDGSYWVLPTGVDIRRMSRQWQEETRQKSLRACAAPPPNCPCQAQPDIWDNGPDYTVMKGPFRNASEAYSAAGDPYIDNGKPGSTKQWRYDTERKSAEVESACRSLPSRN